MTDNIGDESEDQTDDLLRRHPLAARLRPDPDEIPNLVVLIGYPGRSTREGWWRLYQSLDFRTYYEIPRGVIRYAVLVDAACEDGPIRLFVARDAELELVQVVGAAGAAYLAGTIAQNYMAGAKISSQVPATLSPLTLTIPTVLCQTLQLSVCFPCLPPPITIATTFPCCLFTTGTNL